MYPPAAAPAPLLLPAPAPVPVLAGGVQPRASKSFRHVAGAVKGGTVNYADLHACAWYVGGGHELRGPRRAFGVRGLSGGEDIDRRKQ